MNLFYNCSSLTKIIIPSLVTSIEQQAFEGCSSLSKAKLENPCSQKIIGRNAFFKCNLLKEIEISSKTNFHRGKYST